MPLASSYRPLPVAFGVVSVYLVAAVVVTSLLRDRIGHRTWRAIHWSAYVSWPLAIEHTLKPLITIKGDSKARED